MGGTIADGRKAPNRPEARRERQATQLRANLKKRKAQARARAQEDTAQTEAGDGKALSEDASRG